MTFPHPVLGGSIAQPRRAESPEKAVFHPVSWHRCSPEADIGGVANFDAKTAPA
jgi:hypothetical protein